MNFVKLEDTGKKVFAKFPKTRRFLKGIYQRSMVLLSNEKIKSEGNLIRISPEDNYEYFFGYYDKSPWDATDRYMIALQVKNAYKTPDSTEEAKIVVFDTKNNNEMEVIGTTHCWNTQQGCMAQWLAPNYKDKIIYNDFRNNKYVSVVYNFKTKAEEKTYDMPIYDVSKDGSFALTLDFSRLHRLRKGYGYANLKETTSKELCPNKTCIWKINLKTGNISDVIKYTDLAAFEIRDNMKDAEHKVNHIMISPNGKRFMVLHRWFKNNEKFTRLVTMNIDGTDMYNLSDDDFVSHCCWKNDNEILSFLRKKETGNHYYLMKDKTNDYKLLWDELNTDGHCTYSPDGKYVITDTYPNRKRLASVYLCDEANNITQIARVNSPFKYDNDTRCDLHPRWNQKGNKICIDSVHNGKKELYKIDLSFPKKDEKLITIIIPCYNSVETIERTLKSIDNQKYRNIEVVIVDDGSKDNLEGTLKRINISKKIKYLKKENGGVSSARNYGIEKAQGEYLFFLDSDDVYNSNFIEKAVNLIEEKDADTVITFWDRNIDNVEKNKIQILDNEVILNRNDGMKFFMYNKENITFGGLLYKKDIIEKENLKFELNTKYGEDLEFAWKYLCKCNKIVLIPEKMYGYYNNPKSAINTIVWEKTDLIKAMNRVVEYMEHNNDIFLETFENYMLPRTYWTVLKTFAIGEKKAFFKKFINEYPTKKQMKKLVKYSKNKLLKYSSLLYLINENIYYHAIRLVYKIKS
ncbi:MAG: glycosyltransferase [Candidatus Coprovivens sp.]